jgi:hypothetical protein
MASMFRRIAKTRIVKTRGVNAEPTMLRGNLNGALSTEQDVAADQEQE